MKKFILTIILFTFLLSSPISYAEEETLILFDSSLSMAQILGKKPKYVLAIEAVKKYLSSFDDSRRLGFRVIGLSIEHNLFTVLNNMDILCKATRIVNPISSNNTKNIEQSLDNIMPLGVSPLTYSIQTAIDSDFSYGAFPKHIILITDGGESCGTDLCSYAAELRKTRTDVKLDIISINSGIGDIKELKCLTENFNGQFYNIKSAKDFDTSFSNIFGSNNFTNINQYSKNKIKYKNYMFETYE